MAKLVAWSPIKSAKNNGTEKDPDMEVIKVEPGETVTQELLGLDDGGWAQLVESGSVRTMAYPDMPETYQLSPAEFLREEARKAAEGTSDMSEENTAAILAANAAGTGTALISEEPLVAEEEPLPGGNGGW